jgi:hypothetical protein
VVGRLTYLILFDAMALCNRDLMIAWLVIGAAVHSSLSVQHRMLRTPK